jgi:hypothetical protein
MMMDGHVHLSVDEERIPQKTIKCLTDSTGLGILKGYQTIALTGSNRRKDTSYCCI